MSYSNYESSRAKGEVITLYHFFYVNEEEFFYTDGEESVSFTSPDRTYRPIPIQHGAITSSGTLDKANLEIRMPRNAPLADVLRLYPPSDVVNVIIRQMHRTDPDSEALVVWTGRVLSSTWDGNEARLSCEPISTALRRNGLRRNYQIGCPYVLYGAQCAANRANATTPPLTISGASGSSIYLPQGWMPSGWATAGKTVDKFIGGVAQWQYEGPAGTVVVKRTILKITSNSTVIVAGNLPSLIQGSQITLTLGCNHQMTDCQNLHANVPNYGGQPYIPVKNPFGFTNNYY